MLQRIRVGFKNGRRACFWGMGLCAAILVSSTYPILYWRNITRLKAQVAALTARVEQQQTRAFHRGTVAEQDQQFLSALRQSLLMMSLRGPAPCARTHMAEDLAWLATHLPIQTHPQWQLLAQAMRQAAQKIPRVCVMSDVLQTTETIQQRLAQLPMQSRQHPLKFLGMDWSKWVTVRSCPEIPQVEQTVAYGALQQLQWAACLGQSALYQQAIARLKTLPVLHTDAIMQKALQHLATLHVARAHVQPTRLIEIIDGLLAAAPHPDVTQRPIPPSHKSLTTKAQVLEQIRASQRRANTEGVLS